MIRNTKYIGGTSCRVTTTTKNDHKRTRPVVLPTSIKARPTKQLFSSPSPKSPTLSWLAGWLSKIAHHDHRRQRLPRHLCQRPQVLPCDDLKTACRKSKTSTSKSTISSQTTPASHDHLRQGPSTGIHRRLRATTTYLMPSCGYSQPRWHRGYLS